MNHVEPIDERLRDLGFAQAPFPQIAILSFVDGLLSSTGMIITFGFVVIVHVLSLIVLFTNVHLFKVQRGKYRVLLQHLGNVDAFGSSGRFLIPIYVATTIIITAITIYIFVFQPHLL